MKSIVLAGDFRELFLSDDDVVFQDSCETCNQRGNHCTTCFGCKGTHAGWCTLSDNNKTNPRNYYSAIVYDPTVESAFFVVKRAGTRLYAKDYHYQKRAA